MTRHRLCLLLAFCWATMVGFEGAKLFAKEPGLPSWQLVAGDTAGCFKPGEEADLRTSDGVTLQLVARLVVVHVSKDGVVTFGERPR